MRGDDGRLESEQSELSESKYSVSCEIEKYTDLSARREKSED